MKKSQLLKCLTFAMGFSLILGLSACNGGAPNHSVASSSPTESSSVVEGPESSASQGLKYTLSYNETYYILSGIGSCTDTDVVIPSTYENKPVKEIGPNAFGGYNSLQSVTIPDSVQLIDPEAFKNCPSLISIEVSTGNTAYQSIEGNLYTKDGKTLVRCFDKFATSFTIPNSVQYIGDYAFLGRALQSISIGNSVQSIGKYAFSNCDNLQNVSIGNNVQSIGNHAFSDCQSLQNINIPDSVQYIGDCAFYLCISLQSATIGNGVQTIGEAAFTGCTSLRSINFGTSIQVIGPDSFSGCFSLTSIEVSTNNKTYQSIDGNLYSKDGKTLVKYAVGKSATSFTIPNSVQSIGDFAFAYCESLQSVIIPDSVQTIGDSAFSLCSALRSINIGNSVQSIGEYAFYCCISLQSITIPDSVQSIGNEAFSDCRSLTEVTFENTESWYVTETENIPIDGTYISSTDLAKKSKAVEYLTYTYCSYYWYRKN